MMAALLRLFGKDPDRGRFDRSEEADQVLAEVRELLSGTRTQMARIDEWRGRNHGGTKRRAPG